MPEGRTTCRDAGSQGDVIGITTIREEEWIQGFTVLGKVGFSIVDSDCRLKSFRDQVQVKQSAI
jgi:hypothetical protein